MKYDPSLRHDFDYRLKMCQAFDEGSELGDAVRNLTRAAKSLYPIEDFHCQMILLIAEKLCTEYVMDHLKNRNCDWEDYDEFDPEVYVHFTGGATKLTEEEFNRK